MCAHLKNIEKLKTVNIDKLVEVEWDILNDLKKMLQDPALSVGEKIRAANALAYHASVLNRLLAQKGETGQFNDKTLGEFIKGVEAKAARRIRMDFKRWTKRLSLTK